jgi:RNA polymerase sigma-70 factor (ECF subfamily)
VNTQKIRSDQELVQRSANGDQEAYGDLYERYLDRIYRYVYFRVDNAEEAEDLTETTFIRVWEDLRKRKKRKKIKNFSAWLYRVAHNLVIDHQRRKTPLSIDLSSSAEFTQVEAPGTEETVIENLDSQQVALALRKLEPTAQDVLILRFFNGLTHAETADVLELNEGHVRVIQFRALQQLREILNEEQPD